MIGTAARLFILLLLVVTGSHPADAQSQSMPQPDDDEYCSSDDNSAPYRFCLAERRFDRASEELDRLIPMIRLTAMNRRESLSEFAEKFGDVTLEGDPVDAFDASQQAWEVSYRADCELIGIMTATGNAGTEGVTARVDCEAERVEQRIAHLKTIYEMED